MFRCQLCSCVPPPRTAPKVVVVGKRQKQYAARPRVNHFRRDCKPHITGDPGGVGTETVRELLACAECAAKVVVT